MCTVYSLVLQCVSVLYVGVCVVCVRCVYYACRCVCVQYTVWYYSVCLCCMLVYV